MLLVVAEVARDSDGAAPNPLWAALTSCIVWLAEGPMSSRSSTSTLSREGEEKRQNVRCKVRFGLE